MVLCKDYDDIDGLWRRLNESDAPKLWVPERSCFHKVAEFPLLGSGKLDLVALKKTAVELEAGKRDGPIKMQEALKLTSFYRPL